VLGNPWHETPPFSARARAEVAWGIPRLETTPLHEHPAVLTDSPEDVSASALRRKGSRDPRSVSDRRRSTRRQRRMDGPAVTATLQYGRALVKHIRAIAALVASERSLLRLSPLGSRRLSVRTIDRELKSIRQHGFSHQTLARSGPRVRLPGAPLLPVSG
jgi:hypothetical protein